MRRVLVEHARRLVVGSRPVARPRSTSRRGTALLDAVGAAAVALTLGVAATDVAVSVSTLGLTARRERALTVARNLVEHAGAAPCAPLPDCPPEMTCALVRDSLDAVTTGTSRLTATVAETDDARVTVRLASAASSGCG